MRYASVMSGGLGFAKISPSKVTITARGRARVRVSGCGYGRLRVGRESRWVWGKFDESVLIDAREYGDEVAVVMQGIGRDRRAIVVSSPIDIDAPSMAANIPVLRSRIHVPQTLGVVAHRVAAPRTMPLIRFSSELPASESEPTT